MPTVCDPVQKDLKAKVLLFPIFTSPLLRDASTIEKKDRNIRGNKKIISTPRKRIPLKDFQRKTELLLPLNLISPSFDNRIYFMSIRGVRKNSFHSSHIIFPYLRGCVL